MFNGSNCNRKSQLSEILTEPLNPRDKHTVKNELSQYSVWPGSGCWTSGGRQAAGRRPWTTTISSSVPHISFLVFRQPWATTISSSGPPQLTLPGKTTFLNGILRAFKCYFSKIQPRHAKKHNSNHFFNSR
jgi:hypothetical protein